MRAMFPHYREPIERVPEHFAPPGTWTRLEAKFLALAAPSAPVLVVVKHYRITGCGGRNGYSLHTEMLLGILPPEPPFASAGEQGLVADNLTIRVSRHVAWWGYDFHLKEEPIVISTTGTRFADPERPIYSPYSAEARMQRLEAEHEGRKPDYPVEIAVGLVAIHTYVTEHGGSADDFFLKAARMLELQEPLPPALAERDRAIREVIVDDLLGCTAEIAEIETKVAEVFRVAHRGNGVYSPDDFGLSITVCETDDDARVITMGDRMRIRDLHGEIKRALARAIGLRMHVHPWVRELSTPGLTLDVPVYVRTLAEKLGVELPS